MIEIIVQDESPELFGKLQQAVSRFQRKGILHIEGEIKSSMAEPKTGLTYYRLKGSVDRDADRTDDDYSEHKTSAPGESPAVDSSNLIGSIQPFFDTLESKLGTPVEYAAYLEDGTVNMEARPVWERTVQEELPTLETLLAFEIGSVQ